MSASPRILAVHAAEIEGRGLQDSGVVHLGVGKVAAAVAVMEILRAERPDAVLLFGLAGAYPDRHRQKPPYVGVGEVCMCGSDQFADEGVLTEKEFLDLGTLGFGEVGPFAADTSLTAKYSHLLRVPVVHAATVSTCSGTEALSETLAVRSNADVESMEGAAVAWVCRRLGVPFAQLRCISNWTGDRALGQWNLELALRNLHGAMARVLAAGTAEGAA